MNSNARTFFQECPINNTAQVLGKKWACALLLCFEPKKVRHFNDLTKILNGITPKVLSQRLKKLEEWSLVGKKQSSIEKVKKSEYLLTEKGKELQEVLHEIVNWESKWNKDCEKRNCGKMTCADCIQISLK